MNDENDAGGKTGQSHGAATEHHGDELGEAMIRLGLCCLFRDQPIKFVTTTATSISKMKRPDALAKLSRLCMANADALLTALQFCSNNGIGCFRVNSQILPIKTHPSCGYSVGDLPDGDEIIRRFKGCGTFVKKHKLRTCFHPDQFVVMNSPRLDVVEKSVQELEYQAEVAEWIEADVINIHGGGAYGDKPKALADFARNLDRLSSRVRSRLTVENDDKTYTPADLLPICKATGVPLVYDVHHHRCNPDELSVEQATKKALATWNREPMFHLSSPIEGWDGPKPERHHDFIDVADFPVCWRRKKITVEVEAKAKEVAVEKLRTELKNGEPETTWFVYLLRCADGSLYTGISNDIPRRLEQHNAGTASRYTRSRLPAVLVYQEAQASRSLALKRELAIKALSRQEKELLIDSDAKSKLKTALPLYQSENLMAKIASRKFSTAKKKIASSKFPKAQRELSSGTLYKQSAKIPSRKLAKAQKATKKVVPEPVPLGHPTDEQSRQDVVETLKSRMEELKAGEEKRSAS